MKKRHIVIISLVFLFLLGLLLVYAAQWPSHGTTNWDTPLHEVWNVAHNDDGTLKDDIVKTNNILDGTIANGDIAANGVGVDKLNDASGITDIKTGVADVITGGGNLAAGATQVVTVNIAGVDATNDIALCKLFNTDADILIITSTETGAGTVTVRVTNPTAGVIAVDAADLIGCMTFSRP